VASPLRARLCAALLPLLLAACATQRPAQQPLPPAAQLDAFQLDGRITLQVEKERFPGSVRWAHAPRREELWFYSPVGSAVAHLVQDPDGALLVDAQGQEHRAADLRTLAWQRLGWDLPLEGLSWWVRGLAWPGAPVDRSTRDEQGRLSQLEQAGWRIDYLGWGGGNGRESLPSKLDLTGERLRLRLLIQDWSAGDAP
jgi:outer membrane lipoprotein LolB